jgi:hypothetical protein
VCEALKCRLAAKRLDELALDAGALSMPEERGEMLKSSDGWRILRSRGLLNPLPL